MFGDSFEILLWSGRSNPTACYCHFAKLDICHFAKLWQTGLENWVTKILKDRGVSTSVISTLRKARKAPFIKIWYCTWKSYFALCQCSHFGLREYSVPHILAFLQTTLDQNIAPSTLNVQVSALSILFQRPLALHFCVKTFVQGVSHARPSLQHPLLIWDPLTHSLKGYCQQSSLFGSHHVCQKCIWTCGPFL